MAEEKLKEVIARMKAKKQNSQQSEKKVEKPAKQEVPAQTPKEEDLNLDDETSAEEEKPAVSPQEQEKEASDKEISKEQKILMEQELLQNNGVYRQFLLRQLQETNRSLNEVNKALIVIAGVLVDHLKTGEGK